jgi:hypothetical protein
MDFATRFATHSTTSGAPISALAAMAPAAASVNPSAKIARRRNTPLGEPLLPHYTDEELLERFMAKVYPGPAGHREDRGRNAP